MIQEIRFINFNIQPCRSQCFHAIYSLLAFGTTIVNDRNPNPMFWKVSSKFVHNPLTYFRSKSIDFQEITIVIYYYQQVTPIFVVNCIQYYNLPRPTWYWSNSYCSSCYCRWSNYLHGTQYVVICLIDSTIPDNSRSPTLLIQPSPPACEWCNNRKTSFPITIETTGRSFREFGSSSVVCSTQNSK